MPGLTQWLWHVWHLCCRLPNSERKRSFPHPAHCLVTVAPVAPHRHTQKQRDTHTHTHTHSLSLSHTHTLTHTHTHTHTNQPQVTRNGKLNRAGGCHRQSAMNARARGSICDVGGNVGTRASNALRYHRAHLSEWERAWFGVVRHRHELNQPD